MNENATETRKHIEDVLCGTLNKVYETIETKENKPEQLSVLVDAAIKLVDSISRLNRLV